MARLHKLHYALAATTVLLVVAAACSSEEVVSQAPPPEPVQANVSVDKAVATTGDELLYSVEINHDAAITIEIPEIGSQIAGFRIIDFGTDKPVQADGRIQQRSWYKLRGDLVGSYILPSISLTYEHNGEENTVSTSELFVEIESVLPSDGSATDIRGLKPLNRVELDPKWPPYALAAGVTLSLLLLGLWWWRRRQRREHDVPPRPAHEIAYEALERLRATNFDDSEAVRRYFFELSAILRSYIEGRFELNATDLTTEELIPMIRAHAAIDSALQPALRDFLLATDRVKFANHTPSKADIEKAYETTLSFVEATLMKPDAEEAEDSMESAA